MPQSKGKHAGVRAEVVDARRANESTVATAGPAAQAVPGSRCEAALLRALQVAGLMPQAATGANGAGANGAGANGAGADAQPAARAERLLAALNELEPEMALKIRTLLVSGRDGQSVGAVQVAPAPSGEAVPVAATPAAVTPAAATPAAATSSTSAAVTPAAVTSNGAAAVAPAAATSAAVTPFATMTVDAEESGPCLVDYLRRGHAIACAMDIDVDSPIANWRSPPSPDLDERAWLSFGKQLASSKPEDWEGFGVPESPAQGFSKLYLKLGENAWWSFQATLDRPTSAGMAKERRALAKRRVKGVPVQTLESLAAQLGSSQGRALKRASRAIRARVGRLGPALASVRK